MTRSVFLVLASFITIVGMIVVVAAATNLARHDRARTLSIGLLAVFLTALIFNLPVGIGSNLVVLGGAIGGAVLIGRGLGEPRSVIAFLVVAGLVDWLSFADGLTRAIVEGYRTGESLLLLHLTLVAPVGGQWVPIVGVGDLVIAGAAGAALVRFGKRFWRVSGVLSGGLLLALAVGLWRGGAAGVPFMALTVSAAYAWPKQQRGTRRVQQSGIVRSTDSARRKSRDRWHDAGRGLR